MTDLEYAEKLVQVRQAFADCGDKIELETWDRAMAMSRALEYKDQLRVLTDHFEKLLWKGMETCEDL